MATPVPQPDGYEPDDAKYEASPFAVNGPPQRHNFHIAGDEDWVKFWAWAGNEYTIRTFDLDDGNDTTLCLYDAQCNELACNDDDPNNPPASRIVWPVSENGTYFVQAAQWAPIGWNLEYSLSISDTVSCKDEYEPDDLCDEADQITVGLSQEHNFHGPCGGDEDWVKFRGVAGNLYTIKTFELGDGNDTMLQLYDKNSNLLAENDDDPDNIPASRIDFTPPITMSGEFFCVRVVPFHTSAGGCDLGYLLKVTERAGTPTPSPTPTAIPTCADEFESDDAKHEARRITPNDPPQEDRNFHIGGDEDWVKFWAWAGNEYTIRTFDLGGGNNTTLRLYDALSNDELAFNDDGSDPDDPLASQIVFTAPEKGSYFVKVAPVKPSIGGCSLTYSLQVTESVPCRDEYEPDDNPDDILDEAHQIIVNGPPQEGNFHVPCFNDYHRPDTEDWVWFEAEAGYTYTLRTLDLGGGSDTELCLYTGPPKEPEELECNDDDPKNIPASRIDWKVTPYNTTYLIKVSPFISVIGGCDITYLLQVSQEPTSVTLEAMPITPTVDEGSVLTATVRQDEKVISGKTVTFIIVSGSGTETVTPTTATTNASGQATTTIRSCVPDSVTVEAKAGAVEPVTDTKTVTFSVGAPATVTLDAKPITLTVRETSYLTATVVDRCTNLVSGTLVTFTVVSGPGRVIPPTATTDASGEATATLQGLAPGTVTVEARAGSMELVTATKTVSFTHMYIYLPLILKNYPPCPDLSTSTKSVDLEACQRGDVLRYTITLANTGSLAASVTLTDLIPSGATFVQDSLTDQNCTYNSGAKRVECSPTLQIGGSETVVFQVKVDDCPVESEIVNEVTINDGYSITTKEARTTIEPPPILDCPPGLEEKGPICSGIIYQGLLCEEEKGPGQDLQGPVGGKSRWYFMDITTSKPFSVRLTQPSRSADYDVYVLYAQDLDEAIEKEQIKDRLCGSEKGTGEDELAECNPIEVGRHYIRVRCWENPDPINPYTLRATFQ